MILYTAVRKLRWTVGAALSPKLESIILYYYRLPKLTTKAITLYYKSIISLNPYHQSSVISYRYKQYIICVCLCVCGCECRVCVLARGYNFIINCYNILCIYVQCVSGSACVSVSFII